MDRLLLAFRQNKFLNTIFLSNIFISLHYALIIYINSSFLSQFFTQTQVSSLYIIGSIINTYLLLNASKILAKIGIYKFVIYSIGIEILGTIGMFVSISPTLIGIYFLMHLVNISLLLFGMDIFLESFTKDHSKTGSIRATYLTITNTTIMIAPALVALLLVHNMYALVYISSALFLVPLYHYMTRFRNLTIAPIKHIQAKETLVVFAKDKDLAGVFTTQFLLQLFYAFMVVYTPIYMNKYIGFSLSEIGIIFTIMLIPFIIVELPVGNLEDDKYGEKEFLTIGFIIMGLSTIFISFITAKSFWIWAAILFITRIGASIVEISSDTYFFKKVSSDKTDVISFFRITRPLSFIIAPLLATIMLQFIPFQYMFIIIGSIMIIGTHYSLALRDTL
jgi:MFS family permease